MIKFECIKFEQQYLSTLDDALGIWAGLESLYLISLHLGMYSSKVGRFQKDIDQDSKINIDNGTAITLLRVSFNLKYYYNDLNLNYIDLKIHNKQYFKLRKNIFFLISSLTFKNISGIYNDF